VQRKYIDALGGVQTLIEVDTCHMVLVSEPERLANILVERAHAYAGDSLRSGLLDCGASRVERGRAARSLGLSRRGDRDEGSS
jgi:hypothetical protein